MSGSKIKVLSSEEIKKIIQNNTRESRREWILQMMLDAGKQNSNNRNFQLWQQDNHPIELSTEKMMHQKLDYLHDNPCGSWICRASRKLVV